MHFIQPFVFYSAACNTCDGCVVFVGSVVLSVSIVGVDEPMLQLSMLICASIPSSINVWLHCYECGLSHCCCIVDIDCWYGAFVASSINAFIHVLTASVSVMRYSLHRRLVHLFMIWNRFAECILALIVHGFMHFIQSDTSQSVSYTHLTLPTKA